jgi:hypothetical protein
LVKILVKKVLTLLFEDFVWDRITVLVGIIARWGLIARLERWVLNRGRYATLALFALPISALVPIKLTAVYLIVSGHALAGILVIIAAKVVGTAISARLYIIAQPKLMTFEAFVRVRAKVLHFKDWARQVLAGLRVPEAIARVRAVLRGLRRGAAMEDHRSMLRDRLLAARRLLRRSE